MFCHGQAKNENVWDFSKISLKDSGWTVKDGKFNQDKKFLIAPRIDAKNSCIGKKISFQPGLYELTVLGEGNGNITMTVNDPNSSPKSRTLKLQNKPGLCGLLFNLEKAGECTIEIKVISHSYANPGKIEKISILPATEKQKAAWKAAEESFVLLGYYGTDPQRPAPGSNQKSISNVKITPENIKNWQINEMVIFNDPNYDNHWGIDAGKITEFFVERGVKALNAKELTEWLKAKSKDTLGVGSSLIFPGAVVPECAVNKPFENCLLAKYLQAGGRAVMMGNIPMYVAQGEHGPKYSYGTEPGEVILGLVRDRKTFYGIDEPGQLTKAGKNWGIESSFGLQRPVATSSVSIPFSLDKSGKYCGSGLCNLNKDLPFSGLIFTADRPRPGNLKYLQDVYRMAKYVGEPVSIPKPVAIKKEIFPVNAELKLGKEDIRGNYLRNESVPIYLELQSTSKKTLPVDVVFEMKDGDKVVKSWQGKLEAGKKKADNLISFLNFQGLKMGKYQVNSKITADGKTKELKREVRICPQPDHKGLHIALWCESSPKANRTEDLLKMLKEKNIEPMFVCENAMGRDMALWYGFSFSVREHGRPENVTNPPGYDCDKRGSSGKIMRVRAQGNKRSARGYASPFKRQAEADDFGRQIAFDNKFPAFRKYSVTADDYSQWNGMDFNRFNVEGFKARYGFDIPRPKGTEDPYGTVNVDRPKGLIEDDDPWVLATRYWSESVYGNMGKRLADAMRKNTGGTGKVGPVPGAMQIPVMQLWSGQFPPFNFGPNGFSLINFYYYNSFWQPELAHVWWLECSRMGNRDMEQWIMPDCYINNLKAYHRNNGWLMLAGGATGMEYFRHSQNTTPEGMASMFFFGTLSQKYGKLLGKLKPVPKKVGMLIPLENITFKIPKCIEMAYPFMEMLQAKVDVQPVCPEELNAENIRNYEGIILPNVLWLKKGTAKLLEDYIKAGGKVIEDKETAKYIDIPGAVKLDYLIGGRNIKDYGHAKNIKRTRESLEQYFKPWVTCDDPFVILRRFEADNTQFLYAVHTHTSEEYLALKAKPENEVAEKLGYDKDIISTVVTAADNGTIPYDVFTGKALPVERKEGKMLITVSMPKWEGTLIDFLPAVPETIEVKKLETAKPGVAIKLVFFVKDKDQKIIKSIFPLNLKVSEPDGKESVEYSRRLLAENGAAIYQFEFAVNDKAGIWEFELTEPITGLKKVFEINLEKN
jgi:hypothetical protein